MRRSEKRKEEMYLAVELWQESGLSQRAFCEKEGISYQVFGYWLRKFRQKKAPGAGKRPGFVDVNVGPSPAAEGISIHYPNGVVLTCSGQLAPQTLKTLIGL